MDDEVINAADEWWDRECRPRPPKPALIRACVQAVSVVSMEKQDEKHLLTSLSNSFKEGRIQTNGPYLCNHQGD